MRFHSIPLLVVLLVAIFVIESSPAEIPVAPLDDEAAIQPKAVEESLTADSEDFNSDRVKRQADTLNPADTEALLGVFGSFGLGAPPVGSAFDPHVEETPPADSDHVLPQNDPETPSDGGAAILFGEDHTVIEDAAKEGGGFGFSFPGFNAGGHGHHNHDHPPHPPHHNQGFGGSFGGSFGGGGFEIGHRPNNNQGGSHSVGFPGFQQGNHGNDQGFHGNHGNQQGNHDIHDGHNHGLNFGGEEESVNCKRRRNRDHPSCQGEERINCDRRKNHDDPACQGNQGNQGGNRNQGNQGNRGQGNQGNRGQGNQGNRGQGNQGNRGQGNQGNRGNRPNCRGKRKNRPECKNQQGQGQQDRVDCTDPQQQADNPECQRTGAGPPTDPGPGRGVNCRRKQHFNNPACLNSEAIQCHKKRFRSHPQCQAPPEFASDPDAQLGCNSKRKKKQRQCQERLEQDERCKGNMNQNKYKKNCLGTGEVSQAFDVITWFAQYSAGDLTSLTIPGLPDTPGGAGGAENRFLLANEQRDLPFQQCVTPTFRRQGIFTEQGHCRYLHHCILPVFVNNFNIFLKYVCIVEGKYLGICCPDSRYPEAPPPPPVVTTAPTTTLRPPTSPSPITQCGKNTVQQTRIVGGTNAQINEFPWQAALLRAGDDSQYCGGVLIGERWVLTAAHCIDAFKIETIKVRLGEYTFGKAGETNHNDFALSNMLIHEQYSRTTYVNDIAILTLEKSTKFSAEIWPVCLPPPAEQFVGSVGTVVGWGTIYYGGPVETTLQKVNLPVWTNIDCNNAYPDNEIFPQNLCAGVKEGGKDSCQGDSGGPLLLSINGFFHTIGVVSWGIRCAEKNKPGVYARVNMYLDWIDSNTKI